MTPRAISSSLLIATALASCFAVDACSVKTVRFGNGSSGYDVIVVGSGAGGGPLAARLAEKGRRVLLLEAGDDVGTSLSYEVPARHALSTEDPTRAWSYYVQHHRDPSVDQQDSKYVAPEQGILYPRGSALGGSTAVNAMVTVLPPPSDWDRLAELTGDATYRAVSMARYYDAVREWLPEELADPSVAAGDPVVTGFLFAGARATSTGALHATSLAELFGPDLNQSLLTGETTGFFRIPYATSHGRRTGTRERIVDVAKYSTLTVSTSSFVTRVLFDTHVVPPRAIGVEYRTGHALYSASADHSNDAPSETKVALAHEVVLSAGSFNTPQILMLSGVGDPDQLGALGIDVVAPRKGVGQNLQDRYEAGVVAEMDQPIGVLATCALGSDDDPCLRDWQGGRGVYQTPGFLATALIRSAPDLPRADLQIFAVPADARGYYPGYSAYSAKEKTHFSWLILKAHAQNKSGSVQITTSDPQVRPHIQMNVFDGGATATDPDMAAMVAGVRVVRKIHEEFRSANSSLGFREVWPGPEVASDEEIAAFVNKETWGHHACCTDKMGTPDDAGAVVDSHFRVLGVSGLRVVDASVFPEIPGTFIALPTFMMAEKAAVLMLEDDAP